MIENEVIEKGGFEQQMADLEERLDCYSLSADLPRGGRPKPSEACFGQRLAWRWLA